MRAPIAPRSDRGLDSEVELGHRDLEVVAHAAVRGIQEVADTGSAVGTQHGDRVEHALILGDDVPDAPEGHVVEQLLRARQVIHGQVAQRGCAQRRGTALARGAALAVPARRVTVLHPGVDDEDGELGVSEAERHELALEALWQSRNTA